MVVLPIQAAKFLLGINAEIADIASEYTDSSRELAFTEEEDAFDSEAVRGSRRDALVLLRPSDITRLSKTSGTSAASSVASSLDSWATNVQEFHTGEHEQDAEDETAHAPPSTTKKEPCYAHQHDPVGLSKAQVQDWRLDAWNRLAEREVELKKRGTMVCYEWVL